MRIVDGTLSERDRRAAASARRGDARASCAAEQASAARHWSVPVDVAAPDALRERLDAMLDPGSRRGAGRELQVSRSRRPRARSRARWRNTLFLAGGDRAGDRDPRARAPVRPRRERAERPPGPRRSRSPGPPLPPRGRSAAARSARGRSRRDPVPVLRRHDPMAGRRQPHTAGPQAHDHHRLLPLSGRDPVGRARSSRGRHCGLPIGAFHRLLTACATRSAASDANRYVTWLRNGHTCVIAGTRVTNQTLRGLSDHRRADRYLEHDDELAQCLRASARRFARGCGLRSRCRWAGCGGHSVTKQQVVARANAICFVQSLQSISSGSRTDRLGPVVQQPAVPAGGVRALRRQGRADHRRRGRQVAGAAAAATGHTYVERVHRRDGI